MSGTLRITLNEFHLMLSKMNIHLSRTDVIELFGYVDLNNNGTISTEVCVLRFLKYIIHLNVGFTGV